MSFVHWMNILYVQVRVVRVSEHVEPPERAEAAAVRPIAQQCCDKIALLSQRQFLVVAVGAPVARTTEASSTTVRRGEPSRRV